MPRYVAVTGCAGFIGRTVTRQLLERGDYVYGVDALTYAASPTAIADLRQRYGSQFCFVNRDIRELGRWPDVDAVLHLAAHTHVDNSLAEGAEFVATNVSGTAHLLEMTRGKGQHGMPRFIHISTDETYGSVDYCAAASSPLRPSSPYAASKAAADLLVQAWGHTYGLPYTIVRPTNAYGRNQHPEKLVPKTVRSFVLGRSMPIHGDGSAVRQWLNVEDAASAILFVLDNFDRTSNIVNVGGNTSASVGQVVTRIAELMGVDMVLERRERPGLDARYAVDDSELRQAGWQPTGNFWSDLPEIVSEEAKSFRF